MTISNSDLRQYLRNAYNSQDFDTLCSDYFRDVYQDFTVGMTKGQQIQLLLDYCERHGLFPNLLAALERDRPEKYREQCETIEGELLPTAPRPQRDSHQVFVSHAHDDAEFAHRLTDDLQRNGWRVWIAPDSIRSGEKWVEAINRALDESGVFVVALTPAAVDSKWVQHETNSAIALANKGRIRLIPAEVASCEVPPLWDAYQQIGFTGRYADGLAALLVALNEGTAAAPPPIGQPSAAVPTQRGHAAPARKIGSEAVLPRPAPLAVLTITAPVRMELVQIPAGEFLMGSDPTEDELAKDDEMPQHSVHLREFWISKHPVTNEQYAVFVRSKRYRAPADWKGNRLPAGTENNPVTGVSWRDAVSFCRWLQEANLQFDARLSTEFDVQLPTEAEWEKAARGTAGLIYPWGNQSPDETRLSMHDGRDASTSVERHPMCASPYGVLDMTGNVWEWTRSLYQHYPYQDNDGRNTLEADGRCVVRGGSHADDARKLRCAVRGKSYPDRSYIYIQGDIGFRVVAQIRPEGSKGPVRNS